MPLIPALKIGYAASAVLARRKQPVVQVAARTSALLAGQPTTLRRPPRRVASAAPTVAADPFAYEELCARIGGRGLRTSATRNAAAQQADEEEKESRSNSVERLHEELKNAKWTPVYRFRGIWMAAFWAHAKIIQTVVSAGVIPYVTNLYFDGQMTGGAYTVAMAAALFAPIALVVYTRYLNRMIGVIAVNEERTILRIGYLSFWGARRNRYVDVSDVVPLTDIYTPGVSGAALLKFEQLSDPQKYLFVSTRNAEILEPQVAETIFGTTSYFGRPAEEEKHAKKE